MQAKFKPKENTKYKISSSKQPDLCLTINKSVVNHGRLHLTSYTKSSNQHFTFAQNQFMATYYILSSRNEEKICLEPQKFHNGEYVRFNQYKNSSFQHWFLQPIEDQTKYTKSKYYKCKLRCFTGHYIDLYNQKIEKENMVILWVKTHSPTQIWHVQQA